MTFWKKFSNLINYYKNENHVRDFELITLLQLTFPFYFRFLLIMRIKMQPLCILKL